MDLNLNDKVTSFEDMGMTDPYKSKDSIKNAILHVKTYDFLSEIYPHQTMRLIVLSLKSNEPVKPPGVIFLPAQDLCRKMMRALAEFGKKEDKKKLLLRFGLEEELEKDEFLS